jgi:hypothetical protein
MKPKWRLNRAANLLVRDLRSKLDCISPDLLAPIRKPTRDPTIYREAIELCTQLARLQNIKYGYIYIHYRNKIEKRAKKRCSTKDYLELLSAWTRIPTTYEMLKQTTLVNGQIDLSKPLPAIELDLMQFAQNNLDLIVPIYLAIIPTKSVQGFIEIKNNKMEFLLVDANESLSDRFPVTAIIDTSEFYHRFLFDAFIV